MAKETLDQSGRPTDEQIEAAVDDWEVILRAKMDYGWGRSLPDAPVREVELLGGGRITEFFGDHVLHGAVISGASMETLNTLRSAWPSPPDSFVVAEREEYGASIAELAVRMARKCAEYKAQGGMLIMDTPA